MVERSQKEVWRLAPWLLIVLLLGSGLWAGLQFQDMHEQLSQKHPLLGEAMKFVNQGEDPELTRLAAERYTQFKLSKLD